jgi:hypothetical protein
LKLIFSIGPQLHEWLYTNAASIAVALTRTSLRIETMSAEMRDRAPGDAQQDADNLCELDRLSAVSHDGIVTSTVPRLDHRAHPKIERLTTGRNDIGSGFEARIPPRHTPPADE